MQGLGALIVAPGSAFGPTIYAACIQLKARHMIALGPPHHARADRMGICD